MFRVILRRVLLCQNIFGTALNEHQKQQLNKFYYESLSRFSFVQQDVTFIR